MRRPSGHSSWTNLNVSKFEKIVIDATAAAATILKRQITPIRLTLFSRVINFLSSVQRLRPTAVRLELERAQNFWASSLHKLLSQSLIYIFSNWAFLISFGLGLITCLHSIYDGHQVNILLPIGWPSFKSVYSPLMNMDIRTNASSTRSSHLVSLQVLSWPKVA